MEYQQENYPDCISLELEKRNPKKNKLFLFLLFSLLLIILCICFIIFKNKVNKDIPPWFKEKLIIHALGEYNNYIYLNALEPLKYWYFEKKMHLMEVDFFLTKDKHIVLSHNFKVFNFEPTLQEFKKLKGKGNTTTMTFEDLVSFMLENKDLYIMTDTKYSDIPRIEIEFDEMTSILNNHKELYDRYYYRNI